MCDFIQGCVFLFISVLCDDGNKCMVGDMCEEGECKVGEFVCQGDDVSCFILECDFESGQCNFKVKADGSECDDGNFCSVNIMCIEGVCSGEVLDCDDGQFCIIDKCKKDKGCSHIVFNNMVCDDGDSCTNGEFCDNGVCQGGEGQFCDDGNFCTDDSCDEVGECSYQNNSVFCDLGNVCSQND